MVVEPIDYSASTGRALLQGLTAGRAIQGMRQTSQEMDAAAQQRERQQAAYTALQNARPEDLPALRMQYPEFADLIQKEIGIQDAEHATFVNKALNKISIAVASGNPAMVQTAIEQNKPALMSFGVDPQEAIQMAKNDPQQFGSLLKASMYATMPIEKQIDAQQKQQQLDETARSNRAGEALQGQQIAVSRENSMRSSGGQTPASVREYQYFNSLSPEQQKTYLRVRGRPDGGGTNVVQLADGRTVNVTGKLHGSGANAFYEGIDDAGNMVKVPASAIASPPTSAASAQNYAMKKDLDAISGASSEQLGFMTGITGGNGTPSWDAEVRSRWSGGDQRQLYNATKRIQGKMQNQGIAAARDMGASGINTVAEAKMYFQGMPQVDYSSPEAMQQSVRDIQQYTDNYNQQYQVNVGGGGRQPTTQQPAAQQPAGGSYTSKSGIQFTVR